MNLLLLQPLECNSKLSASDLQNPKAEIFTLSGKRARDAIKEHHLKQGITLLAGVYDGPIGHATLLKVAPEEIVVSFIAERSAPPKLPITLAVAYSRPQASKRVMQMAAQAGVNEVHFFPTTLGQKSYQQSGVFSVDEINQQLALGLQQGCDTVRPRLSLWKSFKQFTEFLSLGSSPQVRFVADTCQIKESKMAFSSLEQAMFIVGSEQGFTSEELSLLQELNCASLNLGPRILKVDVACAFLLGAYHQMKRAI